MDEKKAYQAIKVAKSAILQKTVEELYSAQDLREWAGEQLRRRELPWAQKVGIATVVFSGAEGEDGEFAMPCTIGCMQSWRYVQRLMHKKRPLTMLQWDTEDIFTERDDDYGGYTLYEERGIIHKIRWWPVDKDRRRQDAS